MVEHYSINDAFYDISFSKMNNFLANFNVDDYNTNLNDISRIIELYIVTIYTKDYDKLNAEGKNVLDGNKDKISQCKAIISKHLSNYNINNVIDDIAIIEDSVEIDIKFYFEMLAEYKKINIVFDGLKELYNRYQINLEYILIFKEAKKHAQSIKNIFLNNPETISFYIDEYMVDSPFERTKKYLPELTNNEFNELVRSYIEQDQCHHRVLEVLLKYNGKDFEIELPIKLSIDNKIKDLNNKLNLQNSSMFKVYVSVIPDINDIEEVIEGDKINIYLSKDWIDSNLDFATLLNNFIHILRYVDEYNRIGGMNINKFQSSILNDIFSVKIKNSYDSLEYSVIKSSQLLLMISYSEYLEKNHNISVESLIEWFFNEYIEKEFVIKGFKINLSRANLYSEKCGILFSKIESILKQFAIYVKYGEINDYYLRNYKGGNKFSSYPSLLKNKYYELNSNNSDITTIMSLLFSNKVLSGTRINKEPSTNLASLIYEKKINSIYLDDDNRLKYLIEYLVSKDIVTYENDGTIKFTNVKLISLLKLFRYYEYIQNYSFNDYDFNNELNILVDKGWCIIKDNLFSTKEAKYISYYLNNEEFSDAIGLRNLYNHGESPNISENEHKQNYYNGLMIFVKIIIKINNEFCINDYLKLRK